MLLLFFVVYSKSSFIVLTCWQNAATSSTSTKHDFNVLSNPQYTILSQRDFVLCAILSVTKKSFNYLNLTLWICYDRKNKLKIKPWSFHSTTPVLGTIFISQWNSRVLFLWHTSVKWTCSTFDLKCVPFSPIKEI